MYFYQRFVPGLAVYSYFVADERTKEAAIVDPTRDVEEFLAERGIVVSYESIRFWCRKLGLVVY